MFKKVLSQSSTMAWLIAGLAVFKFALHLSASQNYGYFSDELYTIALSKHLAFGYVDLPPLVPAVVALWRILFGDSLLSIHILSAFIGVITLVFVCLITRELGGKHFAVVLAGLGFIVAPVWLTFNSFLAYDGFDQLILSIFFLLLIKLIKTENLRLWVPLGLVAGIALMTKATILFIGPGFVAALLIYKMRKHLLKPWPWIALGIFLLVISPYLIWEYLNKWPTIEYWKSYADHRVYHATLTEYFLNVVLLMNPLLAPVLLLGIYRLFKPFENKNYGFFGIMFLITFIVMWKQSAGAYMLAVVFMPLLAAGSIFLEEKLVNRKPLKTAVATLILISGIFLLPFSLPLMPPRQLQKYNQALGFLFQPIKINNQPQGILPLTLMGRLGWDKMVRTVAEVYGNLSPAEREDCGIIADYYGYAGAIDLLGQQYNLPHAVSGHLTYYLWGPGEYSWDTMIVVGGNNGVYKYYFKEATEITVVHNDFAMFNNATIPIYLCKEPTLPIERIWKNMKSLK